MNALDHVTVQTSRDVRSLKDVRWVMLDLHGGEQIPSLLRRVLRPSHQDALHAAIQQEKDTGTRPTIERLLASVGGGLSLHVEVARLLVDINRRFLPSLAEPDRYALCNLDTWVNLQGAGGIAAVRWAEAYWSALRGSEGMIRYLNRTLPRSVPFWDFHTYDVHNPDGTLRPTVQMFSSYGGRDWVSRGLCESVRSKLSRLPGRLKISADAIGIDDPYAMFEGCMLPELRHRTVFATEIRKDQFGEDWRHGRAEPRRVARVAAQMAMVLSCLQREALV